MALRLQAMGHAHYRNGFEATLHEEALDLPPRWKRPQAIFVNSMSDLYHKDVPVSFIRRVFGIMHSALWHRFQILTKRAERLAEISLKLTWEPHIWQGVTVEQPDYAYRIDLLRSTGAHVKFLSLEPLLAPMPGLNLKGIAWAIVGGESGPGARPMQEEWVLDIRDQCRKAGVAFYFKQWGGVFKKRNGRLLEGRTWDEMANAPAPPDPVHQLDLVPA